MENKYYTPKLNEFFDGFEYESLDDIIWKKSVFDFRDLEVVDDEIREEIIRVKYLNREDIESFGFKYDSDNFFEGFFNGLIYKILLVNENVWIYFRQNVGNEKIIDKTSFFGKIKNKSELKKLMVQLGIENKLWFDTPKGKVYLDLEEYKKQIEWENKKGK